MSVKLTPALHENKNYYYYPSLLLQFKLSSLGVVSYAIYHLYYLSWHYRNPKGCPSNFFILKRNRKNTLTWKTFQESTLLFSHRSSSCHWVPKTQIQGNGLTIKSSYRDNLALYNTHTGTFYLWSLVIYTKLILLTLQLKTNLDEQYSLNLCYIK